MTTYNTGAPVSSDVLILAALREKQRYKTLVHAVPVDMLGQDARFLLEWYKIYWGAYPEHQHLDLDSLVALLKLRSGYSREQLAIALHQVQRLAMEFPPGAVQGVVTQLTEMELSGRAGRLLAEYNAGGEVDLAYELGRIAQETKRMLSQASPTSWIDDSIESILAEEGTDRGLKFPTAVLRDHIKGILGGTSIAIAARVDKGKGSLVAFILQHFARQASDYFAPDRPLLWLSNEGRGRRSIPRLYSAALGVDTAELLRMSNSGVLREEYAKVVGDVDRIRVKDVHGASLAQIEQIIESTRPCVVVVDMVSNVRLSGGSGNRAEEAEDKWQRLREMAVNHDCIMIGTVQISAEGANMLYPPASAMANSKTGVQGAVDIILTLGALDAHEMQKLRGLAINKNKFPMPGRPAYVESEVIFDAATCQFNDGG